MRCSILRLESPQVPLGGNSIKEGVLYPTVTLYCGSFSLPSSRVHQKDLVEGIK